MKSWPTPPTSGSISELSRTSILVRCWRGTNRLVQVVAVLMLAAMVLITGKHIAWQYLTDTVFASESPSKAGKTTLSPPAHLSSKPSALGGSLGTVPFDQAVRVKPEVKPAAKQVAPARQQVLPDHVPYADHDEELSY